MVHGWRVLLQDQRHGKLAGTVTAPPGCLPHPWPGPSLPRVNAKRSAQGILTFSGKDVNVPFFLQILDLTDTTHPCARGPQTGLGTIAGDTAFENLPSRRASGH